VGQSTFVLSFDSVVLKVEFWKTQTGLANVSPGRSPRLGRAVL